MDDELMKQKYLKYKMKYNLKKASLKKNSLEMQGGALTSANSGVHFVIICANANAVAPITTMLTEGHFPIVKNTGGMMSSKYTTQNEPISTIEHVLTMLKNLITPLGAVSQGQDKIKDKYLSTEKILNIDIFYVRVGDKYITYDLGSNMKYDAKDMLTLNHVFIDSDINYADILNTLKKQINSKKHTKYTAFVMYKHPNNPPILVSINTVDENGKVKREYKPLTSITDLKGSNLTIATNAVGSAASNVSSVVGTVIGSMNPTL